MTNLDSILKSRDITLPTKVRLVKAMVFPVVMYICESWTIKKADYRKIDAFKLWCWISLLRVPWTTRRSNQLILKEINPEYSLEGLILMLKLQYFGHLMWRADSWKKTLMLGKIEGRRRRGCQRMRWCWGWSPNNLATWCEELTHLKRPWCWERLKAGGKGDDRGWDGWMASLIQWTWVCVNSGSWRWTGTPGVRQTIGLQSQT